MAKELIQAFCPICGLGLSESRADHMLDMRNNEKHFGISKSTGYGGLKDSKYIEVEDNPSFYAKLKTLFLAAVATWLEKEWIKKKDLQDLIKQ